jgi:hypothetical protein
MWCRHIGQQAGVLEDRVQEEEKDHQGDFPGSQ